jgi:hypothetical protein
MLRLSETKIFSHRVAPVARQERPAPLTIEMALMKAHKTAPILFGKFTVFVLSTVFRDLIGVFHNLGILE